MGVVFLLISNGCLSGVKGGLPFRGGPRRDVDAAEWVVLDGAVREAD